MVGAGDLEARGSTLLPLWHHEPKLSNNREETIVGAF